METKNKTELYNPMQDLSAGKHAWTSTNNFRTPCQLNYLRAVFSKIQSGLFFGNIKRNQLVKSDKGRS